MANKKILYFIFFFTTIGVLLVGYFFCYPLVRDLEQTKDKLETKKSELVSLEKREKKLKDLKKDYGIYKEKIDILNGMFPSKKNVSPYITNIENSAIANGTIVKSLKIVTQGQNQQKTTAPDYTQLTKKGDLYELPIEIIIQTPSFERTIGFLATLETLSRLTTVDKIQIKSDNNRNLEVIINIRIYVS